MSKKPTEYIMPYPEVRRTVDSYTILNTEHKSWFWRLIGHTAIIYVDPGTKKVFVYEATTKSYTGVSGVQLHLFGEWLDNYPGRVYMRRVHFKGNQPVHWAAACRKLAKHIQKYCGTSYPDLSTRPGRWQLIKAAWDSWLFPKQSTNPDTDTDMYCTKLVGHAFRFGDMVRDFPYPPRDYPPIHYNPSELEPDDTRDGDWFEMYLKSHVIIDQEVRIK